MNKKILILLFLLFLGCDDVSESDLSIKNEKTLKRGGEYVGTLPDGRKITRYEIDRGCCKHNHWIYIVSGSISINSTETIGKTTHNSVQVIIDGIEYFPTEKTNEK